MFSRTDPAERIRLVDEILSSFDQTSPALDASWAAEVEDRIAAYRRGEISAHELSEVSRLTIGGADYRVVALRKHTSVEQVENAKSGRSGLDIATNLRVRTGSYR